MSAPEKAIPDALDSLKFYFQQPGVRNFILSTLFPKLAAQLLNAGPALLVFQLASSPMFRYVTWFFDLFSSSTNQCTYFSQSLVKSLSLLNNKDALNEDNYAAIEGCGDPDELAKIVVKIVEHGILKDSKDQAFAQANRANIASILLAFKAAGLLDTDQEKANIQAVISNQFPKSIIPILDVLKGTQAIGTQTVDALKLVKDSPAVVIATGIMKTIGLLDSTDAQNKFSELVVTAQELFDGTTVADWTKLAERNLTIPEWNQMMVFCQSNRQRDSENEKKKWREFIATTFVEKEEKLRINLPENEEHNQDTPVSKVSMFHRRVVDNADNNEHTAELSLSPEI